MGCESPPLCHLHRQIVNIHLESFVPRGQLVDLLLHRLDFAHHGWYRERSFQVTGGN